MSASALSPEPQAGWWTKPALLIAVILLAGAPLWWPGIPPLTDLPGHMGRYAVQLDGGNSADLARWYHFEWRWIGNLGVDLLVQILGPTLGVEAATKLVAIAIPMLTVAGFLAVAREVHGRVPPTAFFALPLAYGAPFFWGFVNFTLSMALAFLAFALWLRLARLGHIRLRFLMFIPLSLLLWTAHIYGWAAFCVLAASAEIVRQTATQRPWYAMLGHTALTCLCLAPPLVLMVAQFGDGGSGGQPYGWHWFDFTRKAKWVVGVLRDRWQFFDQASLVVLLGVLALGCQQLNLRLARPTGLPLILATGLFALLFLLLPHAALGSAYADMRLLPYVFATALLAIGPVTRRAGLVAFGALSFFGMRMVGNGWSAFLYDQSYQAELAALRHLPHGARLVTFVGRPCREPWAVHRLDHLPSLALVRRRAFANDQWQAAGAQLISVRYHDAVGFQSDPSQFVRKAACPRPDWRSYPAALAQFPRDAFDYVWIIQQPEAVADMAGLEPVWQRGRSALYRVVRTK